MQNLSTYYIQAGRLGQSLHPRRGHTRPGSHGQENGNLKIDNENIDSLEDGKVGRSDSGAV